MNKLNYTQGTPKDPIREVLGAIVGRDTILYWSTGIGIMEAAQNIVEEAVANANIPPKENKL